MYPGSTIFPRVGVEGLAELHALCVESGEIDALRPCEAFARTVNVRWADNGSI